MEWWQVVLLGICGAGFFVYSIYKHQESLVFQPVLMNMRIPEENPAGYRSPEERKLPYVPVKFQTEDKENITGWFIPARDIPSEKAATILYFHANAGNMGFRLPFLEKLFFLTPCNVLIISYRGYGKSSGTPNEEGVYRDATAALKWLQNYDKVDPKRIFLFGRSLGGAVAINLASRKQDQIRGLILENTFTSISAMADKLFPFLTLVKPYILRMKFDSISLISGIKCPILFISGLMDELVPPLHMQKLYDSATSAKRVVIVRVPDGLHNDTWMKGGEYVFDQIRKFIEKTIPDAPKMEQSSVVEDE